MTTPTPDRTWSTAEAAAHLEVPEAAIWKWKHRGLITPAGLVRGRGRGGLSPTYKIDDLRPLALAYHQRAARRAAKAQQG